MAYVTSDRAVGFGIPAWIADTVASIKLARTRRATYLATYRALDAMSDRDLADINLSRLQVRDVAYAAAFGK